MRTSALAALVWLAACGPEPTRAQPPCAPSIARPSDPIDVAVTVDDLPRHGPDVPGTTRLSLHEAMLAAFAKHHVPGVYGFVNAQKLEAHPEDRAALEAWVRAGHPLGNHTYSHPDINTGMPLEAYLADVDKNEDALRAVSGAAPERSWKVFRYPFLREGRDLPTRQALRDALLARHYRLAEVTIDFFDWAYNPAYARCLAKKDQKAIDALKEDYLDRAAFELR
jgi:peptidoglycan/xylan/chitin deacetylase (PgdA/CDA1 family)